MNKSGNHILITGGATGIGYALAEAFLKLDNEVLICGRRIDRLQLAQQNHPKIKIFQCDVSKTNERKALLDHIKQEFTNMNMLINNAGIQRDVNLVNGLNPIIEGENEININLESPIHLSMLFIPFLKEKGDSYIINVSSGLAFNPAVNMPIYCATKAGLHSFTKSLRQQILNAGLKIKVIEIIPPAVESELNLESRQKRGAKFNLSSADFVDGILDKMLADTNEIGFGYSDQVMNASKKELDERFIAMNSRH